MFKLRFTRKFEKSVAKLPMTIKKLLPKTLSYLEEDPHHNSLYSKKNQIASQLYSEVVYESRINQRYRILWKYEDGKVILLLLAGDHEIVEGKK